MLHTCNVCGYATTLKGNLASHARIHTGERPFGCEHCAYRANTKGQITEHTRTHTGERPYPCTLCAYTGYTKSTLDKHMRVHSPPEEKPFSCELCSYKAHTRGQLRSHSDLHLPREHWRFHCKLCSHTAQTSGRLARHTKTHTSKAALDLFRRGPKVRRADDGVDSRAVDVDVGGLTPVGAVALPVGHQAAAPQPAVCLICRGTSPTMTMPRMPCGHQCVCDSEACAAAVSNGKQCPMCYTIRLLDERGVGPESVYQSVPPSIQIQIAAV